MPGVLVTPSVVIFIAESRINTMLAPFPSPIVLHTVRNCCILSTVRKSRLLSLGLTVAKVSVFSLHALSPYVVDWQKNTFSFSSLDFCRYWNCKYIKELLYFSASFTD